MELPFLPIFGKQEASKTTDPVVGRVANLANIFAIPNTIEQRAEGAIFDLTDRSTQIEAADKSFLERVGERIFEPITRFLTRKTAREREVGLDLNAALTAQSTLLIKQKKGEKLTEADKRLLSVSGERLTRELSHIAIGISGGLAKVTSQAEAIASQLDSLDKLILAIKKSKPIRKETEALFTAERARRAAAGTKALEGARGERAFGEALKVLKGELPKPKFAPLKLAQNEVDDLFEMIRIKPDLEFFRKINTFNALTKILAEKGGAVPTETELKLLDTVFGSKLTKALLKKRPVGQKIGEIVLDIVNIPRSLMASMDMSAFLRQGAVLGVGYPKEAKKAFTEMFKFFGSDEIFEAAQQEIFQRPTFRLMEQSKLSLPGVTEGTFTLAKREERFMSTLAEKIPLAGKLVKASERAYVGFLNKLRADVFDRVSQEYIKGGIAPVKRPEVFSRLAEFINTATGRAAPNIVRFGTAANAIFFSPRLMASRLKLLNPLFYAKLPNPVRKTAMKSMVKFISAGIGILSLAKMAGMEVETDPRSSDFGKIKSGNIRWDVWGGFQQWVRLTAQMITGEYKSTSTGEIRELTAKEFPFTTRADRAVDFIKQKFSPVAALVNELLEGQTFLGEELTVQRTLYSKMVPLWIQDLAEAVDEMGLSAVPAVGVPAFFGVGTQTFKIKEKKKKGIFFDLPTLPFLKGLPQLPKIF